MERSITPLEVTFNCAYFRGEMFERFTERALHVVVLAREEACILKHDYIGTEHVLLGLLRSADHTVLQTLAAFELDPDDVRRAVDEADRRAG
jgi:ATP-dependent Clp protease ATP-binding subunit ClpC